MLGWSALFAVFIGGSSVSQNKLPQLIVRYIYILKYRQATSLVDFILLKFITYDIVIKLF